MSGMVLFALGRGSPPRSARRRAIWTIITVVLLLAIGAVLVAASISIWPTADDPGIAVIDGGAATLGGIGSLVVVGAIVLAVIGGRRVREDRARETARKARAERSTARLEAARRRLQGR